MRFDIGSYLMFCCIGMISSSLFHLDLSSIAEIFARVTGADSGKNCNFVCPKNVKPKRNPNHKATSNGCGSYGMEVDVSAYPGFEQCCNKHDKCYDTCNETRDKCDNKFEECLKVACHHNAIVNMLGSKKFKKCEEVGHFMHNAATGFGCNAYKEAQRNSCLCDGKKVVKVQ